MSPRADHRKPAIAFAVLMVVAAVVVGNGLRADASLLQRLWAGAIGAHASVTGAEPSGEHALAAPTTLPSPSGTSTHDRTGAEHGERLVAASRSLTGGRARPGRRPVRPDHGPRRGTGPGRVSGHPERAVPGLGRPGERAVRGVLGRAGSLRQRPVPGVGLRLRPGSSWQVSPPAAARPRPRR